MTTPNDETSPHPLENRWGFWILNNDRCLKWEDCVQKVAGFNTVEEFWSLYHHAMSVDRLRTHYSFGVFKEGIKPMWEDENNVNGGRWLISVDKQKRKHLLHQYWQELLMAMVGEQFGAYGNTICGAIVSGKQANDKLSLWTANASLDAINQQIGLVMKKALDIPDTTVLKYEVHKDAEVRTSAKIKAKLYIPMKETSGRGEVTASSLTSEPLPAEEPTDAV